jgi:hypothetical protein
MLTTKDKHIGVPLEEIYPISERLYSFYARNSSKIKIKGKEINVVGAMEILEAMDYHYSNFISLRNSENNINQTHDVVAYLNRMGQFFTFADSEFCKGFSLSKNQLPKISELILFRHKAASKRNIDLKNSDSKYLKEAQAYSLLSINTKMFLGKKEYWLPLPNKEKNINSVSNWIKFRPEDDHLIIMEESYLFLEKLINKLV